MNANHDRDQAKCRTFEARCVHSAIGVQRLLESIAAEGLLEAYSSPEELHPSNLPVALIHAVHDVPPSIEDAAVVAERYARSLGVDRVHDDPWNLPPPCTQHTVDDLVQRLEAEGLSRTESILDSHSSFSGTDLSRVAYVAAAAKALRSVGIAVLQDVHAVGQEDLARAFAPLPGDGRGIARRLLAYAAADDWVLADEPVVDFVASAIAAPKVSRSGARRLVRDAAYEMLVAPRDLDLRLWLACTEHPTDAGMPSASNDVVLHRHHDLQVHR